MVNTAELKQIFPLCEKTLRHVVVKAVTFVRWPPVLYVEASFIHVQ